MNSQVHFSFCFIVNCKSAKQIRQGISPIKVIHFLSINHISNINLLKATLLLIKKFEMPDKNNVMNVY